MRGARSRWPLRGLLAVVGIGVAIALVVVGLASRDQQKPAGSGHPAAGRSEAPPSTATLGAGLRLLVADAPSPFVLDVDRGTAQRVRGLPQRGRGGITVQTVGEHALVLRYPLCARCGRVGAYLVRRGSTLASRLGTARQFVPGLDGESVWTLSRSARSGCAIQRVGLDGRLRSGDRAVSCRTELVAELPAGLLVTATGPAETGTRTALLRRDGSLVCFRDPEAQPVVGDLLLSGAGPRRTLLLHDIGRGSARRLRWPARPGYSLGEVTGEPDGRRAIVEFARYSPEHRLDLWLLDTASRRWQHLPGMPARIVPKATDVAWTAAGDVVVLAGDLLLTWHPSERRLVSRRVPPPQQAGSEFVIR